MKSTVKATALLFSVALTCGAARPAMAQMSPPGLSAGTVQFRNDLPGSFRLQRVRFWVDGARRYDGVGPFEARLADGAHVVSITAEYRLYDPVFAYMSGYRVVLRSAERVIASNRAPVIVADAIDAGSVTTPVERRAQIAWRLR